MVGISSTSAPRSVNFRESWLACSRVRVTTTRWPKSGRFSNQFSFERSFTTSPTTTTVGGPIFSRSATFAIVSRVPSIECWRPVVPQRTIATGVFGAMPSRINVSAIWPMRSVPIIITFVPGVLATCGQSMVEASLPGSSWPVIKVIREEISRWVSGTPA